MAQDVMLAMKAGRYSILSANLPGEGPLAIGVLLEDAGTDRLHVRLRRDWQLAAPDTYVDILTALEEDLAAKAREMGARQLLDYLTSTLSNFLTVSDPETVMVSRFERTLNELYRKWVNPAVLRYDTHVPFFPLESAAGRFRENPDIGVLLETSDEQWWEVPAGTRLEQGMFAARIRGTSMEPKIPDGAVALFRPIGAGSRAGRLVLVEERTGSSTRYTLKRYQSEKRISEDSYEQVRIRLEPLNPEHDVLELDPEDGRYQIVAEFVRVVEG
jgi:hypothetical protein